MYDQEDDTYTDLNRAVEVQKMINGKVHWRFEGSVGRMMMEYINAGYCILAREDTTDYWGNHIPSRTQVKKGTKGSYAYMKERMGKEWADYINKVK